MTLVDGVSTFVDARGITIHVRSDGARTPAVASRETPLVLVSLHSLGTDMRLWDGVVARLPHHDHLRLDLRGHGLSEAPPGDYTIAGLADDVLAVVEGRRIRRAVVLGVSVGGQIALRVALERPDLVAGVVALDTAARIGDIDAWRARIEAVERGGLAAIADAALARWLPPAYRAREPYAAAGYRSMLERTSARGYVSTCAALRDEDLSPHLAQLHVPLLALCGSEDDATPPALVRALAAGVPNGRYEEIEGSGHLPCLDRPDAVATLVASFVRGLGPA